MQHYTNTVTNYSGDRVVGAVATVTDLNGVAASLYADFAGTIPIGYQVTTDTHGVFSFYAAIGRYNIVVSGSGIATYSITDVFIGDVELVSKLALSTGSSTIGHIATGTGAVARTVQSKLRDSLGFNDFGADPTGAVDSTIAIRAAIAAMYAVGGGELIANGTYKISDYIDLNGFGVRIKGAAVLKKYAAGGLVVSGTFNKIKGITIDGNGNDGPGIVIFGDDNTIDGVISKNNLSHGLGIDGQSSLGHTGKRNTIKNCKSISNGLVGIAQNTAYMSSITGNTCKLNGAEGITIDLPSFFSCVTGNTLIDNCTVGGVGGIGIDQGNLTTVSNNIISHTLNGLPGIRLQNNVASTNYVTITGNVISDNTGGGIHLYSNTVSGFNASYNTIVGNTVFNNTGFSIKEDASCVGNTITGNKCDVPPVFLGGNISIAGEFNAALYVESTSYNLNLHASNNGLGFQVAALANPVNFIKATASGTGVGPILSVEGSDPNISFDYRSKGTGGHIFRTNGNIQMVIADVPSAVNYWQSQGGSGTPGSAVVLSAQGAATNIDATINPKGSGVLRIGTAAGTATTPVSFSATKSLQVKDAAGTVYYIPMSPTPW